MPRTASGLPQPDDVTSQSRRISRLERAVRALDGARRLVAATISSGGLTVKDGGGITVQGGGSVTVEDGGGLSIEDGGGVRIRGGGSFSADYVSGAPGAYFGPLFLQSTGELNGLGILVQKESDGSNIFRAKQNLDGTTSVLVGQTSPEVHVDNLWARANNIDLHSGGTAGLYGDGDAYVSALAGKLTLWGSGDTFLTSDTSGVSISAGGGNAVLQATDATHYAYLGAGTGVPQTSVVAYADSSFGIAVTSNGKINLSAANQQIFLTVATTSSAANGYLDTSGRIWRSTSSARYKQDVEDYAAEPAAVLKLRPRTWRDKAEVERDPDVTTRYVGYVAEEVEAAGLAELVTYDPDGRPDGLSYDRMLAAYHALIVQQQQTITDLVARVTALETHTTTEA